MKTETAKKLKEKGWTSEDITSADRIISARTRLDKSRSLPAADRVVFWSVFAVIVVLNFAVSVVLVPFLLVLEKGGLEFIIVIIGLSFGVLFAFLTNLSNISREHQIFAGIFIPLIALFNFILMVYIANRISSSLGIGALQQNPYFIAGIYVVAFIAPYLVDVFLKKVYKKS